MPGICSLRKGTARIMEKLLLIHSTKEIQLQVKNVASRLKLALDIIPEEYCGCRLKGCGRQVNMHKPRRILQLPIALWQRAPYLPAVLRQRAPFRHRLHKHRQAVLSCAVSGTSVWTRCCLN